VNEARIRKAPVNEAPEQPVKKPIAGVKPTESVQVSKA